MQITPRSRRRLRARNLVFFLLFITGIGLLSWLSARYVLQADWTASARNTLSEASRELLANLKGPVSITAFARDNPVLHKGIENLVDRYKHYKSDIELSFVNPDAVPDQLRELGIRRDGELYLEYRGRGERLQQLTEQGLTNALQSLSRRDQRSLLFLSGHGERAPHGQANHDLGNFGRELERTGIGIKELNLARNPEIPKDTATLVLASPQVAFLPGEIQLIQDYLNGGGNLLWLVEPQETHNLQGLGEILGVRLLPGVIVDADTPLFGIENPTFAVVTDYGTHPITRNLQIVTLFPGTAGLEVRPVHNWKPEELLLTQPRTWTETGGLTGKIRFDSDSDESAGPLVLGVSLSRPRQAQEHDRESISSVPQQRVVVLGDGDFLSNTYLGNGGNLDLGMNVINWLTEDDSLIAIHVKAAPDQTLHLSDPALATLSGGFLLALPTLLLGSGWIIWLRRRRR